MWDLLRRGKDRLWETCEKVITRNSDVTHSCSIIYHFCFDICNIKALSKKKPLSSVVNEGLCL